MLKINENSNRRKLNIGSIIFIIILLEIYSTIKGEFLAHTYPEKYLPLKKYIELSKNKTFKAY